MASLCGVWWCSNMIFYCQYLSQDKEKLLLKDVLCLKRSCVCPPPLYSDCQSHKTNIAVKSPSEWTSTSPVIETSWSIEPNNNNIEQPKCDQWHTIFLTSSSLDCSKQTSTVPLVIMNSFPSSLFPSEMNAETKTNLSLLWKISLPSGGIQEHKNP